MLAWFRRRRAWRVIPPADGTARSGVRRPNVLFTVYVFVVVAGLVWAMVASNTP